MRCRLFRRVYPLTNQRGDFTDLFDPPRPDATIVDVVWDQEVAVVTWLVTE